MSIKIKEVQAEFVFSKENLEEAEKHIKKYPEGRQASAILPLLQLAQIQNNNYLSKSAIEYVANMLGMPSIRAYEVASFYTMFNLEKVGKYLIQLCGTTPCWLCGSDDIKKVCKDKLDIEVGQTSKDGLFTLIEVECLGACSNAPVVQINDDYYEDLTVENFSILLDKIQKGEQVKIGSQIGRRRSEPVTR